MSLRGSEHMEIKSYEKIVIVGVQTDQSDRDFRYSLDELTQLVENAGGEIVGEITQKRNKIDVKTVVGKGKVNELKHLVEETNASTVVFNHELSPSHTRNIQDEVEAKVIDRVQVILDIFALRARSKEGRLQVELAQLNYLLPRLVGQGENMSRLGAGIGTRGPGETKLEMDRRYITKQMTDIKNELKNVEAHRERSRQKRKDSNIFQIGLIGYTNAGKSTIINSVTETDTFEKDILFATLDPLTRKLKLPSGLNTVITDTVGFIQDLPTQLIEAFKSTLEETQDVDLLLHVVDASQENRLNNEETVLSLLDELDMKDIPILTVYNKKDLVEDRFIPTLYPNVFISARDSDDIDILLDAVEEEARKHMEYYIHHIPVERGDLMVQLRQETLITKQKFNEDKRVYIVQGYAKANSYWSTVEHI